MGSLWSVATWSMVSVRIGLSFSGFSALRSSCISSASFACCGSRSAASYFFPEIRGRARAGPHAHLPSHQQMERVSLRTVTMQFPSQKRSPKITSQSTSRRSPTIIFPIRQERYRRAHRAVEHPGNGDIIEDLKGLTGMGDGSLMTPLLILLFGVHPITAVGIDLLYAAVTKAAGTAIHFKKGNVDWHVVPSAQTKAPRKPGRSRYSPGQSLRQRPCLA